ncbi:MAG: ABC transporter ATP-binding protein [Pseudomonadota bacterium]
MSEILLDARDIEVRFNAVRAVDGVSLAVAAGETLAIVGESGCGKTTLGRSLALLQRPTGGKVTFNGNELTRLSDRQLRKARRQLQMVFQDPYASLDPRQRVGDIVGEPLLIAGIDKATRRKRVAELLDMVGLSADMAQRFPREFSGGQRQRIGIARALASEPRLIICDEPLSALDVSIQAQIVNLLIDLQRRLRLTYVFISHDLAVVRQMASRVAVMYLGRIVEIAETEQLFSAPRHPYTVALLSSVPTLGTGPSPAGDEFLLTGDPPSPSRVPGGCRFHTRCWLRSKLGNPERCATHTPVSSGENGHQAACHYSDEIAPRIPSAAALRGAA